MIATPTHNADAYDALRARIARAPRLVILAFTAWLVLSTIGVVVVGLEPLFATDAMIYATAMNFVGIALCGGLLWATRPQGLAPEVARQRFVRRIEAAAWAATAVVGTHVYLSGCFSTAMFSMYLVPLSLAAWALPSQGFTRVAAVQATSFGVAAAACASGLLPYAPIYRTGVLVQDAQADWRVRAVILVTTAMMYGVVLTFLAVFRRVLDRRESDLDRVVAERTQALAASHAELAERARASREAEERLAERRAEAERQRARLRSFERERALGELAAWIAHELNQPLGAIELRGAIASRLLRRDGATADVARESLQAALDSAHRARGIIDGLRRLHGEQRTRDPIDLTDVVLEATSLARRQGDRAGVEVVAHPGVFAVDVLGDAAQLTQVIYNLVHNAVQALERASSAKPSVAVRVRSLPRDSVARVEVSDNGPGLPPGVDVFEGFVTTRSTGLGLGLALSSSIVEAHDGRIWHEPTPGGGATFILEMPLASQTGGAA